MRYLAVPVILDGREVPLARRPAPPLPRPALDLATPPNVEAHDRTHGPAHGQPPHAPAVDYCPRNPIPVPAGFAPAVAVSPTTTVAPTNTVAPGLTRRAPCAQASQTHRNRRTRMTHMTCQTRMTRPCSRPEVDPAAVAAAEVIRRGPHLNKSNDKKPRNDPPRCPWLMPYNNQNQS